MAKFNWMKRACAVLALCASTSIALSAQTFTRLHSFDNTDGANPYAGLVEATNGNLYGTTADFLGVGGTVFEVTPSGALTTLYTFCAQSGCLDGYSPYSAPVQGGDGNFYGTTVNGGAHLAGTIFKMTPSGSLTTLHSFTYATDGENPYAGLFYAADGNFYGTNRSGGGHGQGTVFKIDPTGTLTTLYSFCSQSGCSEGSNPFAALIQSTDGNFYGTATLGGANGDFGTVFKITPGGMFTTLYSFCSQSACADGDLPWAALVQATDGNFYGTTQQGGANGQGTVFKITPGGTLTTLYSFCEQNACTDGQYPIGALLQATDGNLYGTASNGGTYGSGSVYKISPSGKLTTIYSFCPQAGCTDGSNPMAALIQDTNGKLYGTTAYGGASGVGTVFSLSVGLGPFVETQPALGKVGQGVRILGTNLTGATSVTFNGTPAVFHVASPSFITATVPVGATSGKVQVVTPSGTLSSNVPFRARP